MSGRLHVVIGGKELEVPCDSFRSDGPDTGWLLAYDGQGRTVGQFRSEDVKRWWYEGGDDAGSEREG